MKIGDWETTIIAEKAYWVKWVGRLTDKWRRSDSAGFYAKYRAEIILMVLDHQGVHLKDETRILEVGGGLVDEIRYFPTGRLFGADPLRDFFVEERKNLGKAWQKVRHDVTYLSEKAEDLPLDSGPFDIVVMVNSLDHCEDPDEVLRRLAMVMKKGAWLFEATTVWGTDDREAPPEERYGKLHPHLYRGEELNRLITGMGFYLVEDPMGDGSLEAIWTKDWKKGAWPCYLRVWRKS